MRNILLVQEFFIAILKFTFKHGIVTCMPLQYGKHKKLPFRKVYFYTKLLRYLRFENEIYLRNINAFRI